MGDKGYLGEKKVIIPFKGRNLPDWEWTFNKLLTTVRVTVERAIGRTKKFQILKMPFRHEIFLHPIIFVVCAQIAAISIKLNPLIYKLLPLLIPD